MGGVGGHMSHLYENRELTFKQLKEVLIRASSGELEGTEKTDGKNLFVSYSVQTGRAKAARNKGNIKQGGLTPEEVAQKFEGRGELTSAFVDSFKAFEKAVQSLDPETQIAIFGPDANIYYQSEVQTPSSPNVINYDTDTLVIHQVGHAQFDKETGNVADVNVSKNAKILDKVLSQMQGAIEDERFNIERNAVKILRALDNDLALNTAIEGLDNIMREAGVTDNDTIADYMIAQLTPFVERNITLNKEKMKMLIKRLFKVKGVTFNKIVKGMDRDDKEIIRAILKSENKIMKQAIAPIEHVVHDFSVEMLKGLHSAFILDNPKEVMRLRKETQQAIQAIERSGDEQAIAVLQQQMEKLKNIENISTAVEGFVFDYDGATYKFTGNFAPMNQILGLFRYGRGGKKLDLTEDEVALNDYDVDISGYDTIALVPGGFKPPHRGHLDMVKKVAGADRVLILMGSGGKSPRTIGDTVVDYNTAASIWSMLLADAGIDNYDFIEVPEGGTPIRKAFEILEHMTLPGQTVYMLTSDKDTGRFGQRLQNYAPEEVNVEAVEVPTTRSKTGEQLSARFLRDYIANNNFEEFLDYIPKESEHRAEEIYTMLGGKKKVTEEIFRIVEYFLAEKDYQKSPTKKAYLKKWHQMWSTGPQDPGPPYTKKRPKKVGPAPVGFGAFEEEKEKSLKKRYGKFYDIALLHGDSIGTVDGDLEEIADTKGTPPQIELVKDFMKSLTVIAQASDDLDKEPQAVEEGPGSKSRRRARRLQRKREERINAIIAAAGLVGVERKNFTPEQKELYNQARKEYQEKQEAQELATLDTIANGNMLNAPIVKQLIQKGGTPLKLALASVLGSECAETLSLACLAQALVGSSGTGLGEVSGMGAVGGGAVAGYGSPFPGPKKRKKIKYDGYAKGKDEATGNKGAFLEEDTEFIDEVLDYLLNIMEP